MYAQVCMKLGPFQVSMSSTETLKSDKCNDAVIIMHISVQVWPLKDKFLVFAFQQN